MTYTAASGSSTNDSYLETGRKKELKYGIKYPLTLKTGFTTVNSQNFSKTFDVFTKDAQ
jgi:hypothetical protein